MKLFNTLTKKTEEFIPIKADKVGVYSCGPTVYNDIHIGNLSSFIYADTLRRVLVSSGLEVEHVMNFTDVDDKTIRRSIEQYPKMDAKKALAKLTEMYSEIFLQDMRLIGNDIGAITFTKATASIEAIKKHITSLVENGFAYITEDGVYFSISKYKQSGKTYGQLADISGSTLSEARIDNDEYDKESVHDFALWKTRKDGEPAWEFTISGKDLTGRPGWHIECSVMSEAALGVPFDIHTGGIDLIFPHHENEIAQSTAGKKEPLFSRYFVHNEHLLIDGRKMSKSLNNFFTLKDITEKGFDPLALRLMLLQTHYRKQANFTWEGLQSAANRLGSLRGLAELRFQPQIKGIEKSIIAETKKAMETALCNDLALPEALASLSGLASAAESCGVSSGAITEFKDFIAWLDDILGLNIGGSKDIPEKVRAAIKERSNARANKEWAESDRIRDELEKEGIGLRDTEQGAVWYRV